jgi:hypothetical protein
MPKLAPPVERALKKGVPKDEKLAPGVARALNNAAANFKFRPKRVRGLDDNWKAR